MSERVGSEFRGKEEVTSQSPAFHSQKGKTQGLTLRPQWVFAEGTNSPSFLSKGPPDLPSVRLAVFGFPPPSFTVVGISKVFTVGPTGTPFKAALIPGDELDGSSGSGGMRLPYPSLSYRKLWDLGINSHLS